MVSRQMWIAAAAGVLMTGVLWLCWSTSTLAPSTAAAAVTVASPRVVADEAAAAGETPTALLREAAVATSAATATAALEADGQRLRIVDEAGRPLPGAEYFVGPMPSSSMQGLLEAEAWREHWQPDLSLAQCTRSIADAEGYVRSSTTDVPWLYVARHAGQLAFWGWPFPDELQFLPEPPCVVRVVDTAGVAVAGAAIVLRDDDEPGTSNAPIVGITDANGECRVHHLQRLQSPRIRDGVHRLGVRGLGLRSADVSLDPLRVPERVMLTVPPCAPLAVELVDPLGRRYSSQWPLLLVAGDREELQEHSRATEAVLFGHCAIGVDLHLHRHDGPRLTGPPTANRRHLLRVALGDIEPNGTVFIGRACRANGEQLASVRLGAGDSERLGLSDTTTATDGRFALVFTAAEASRLVDRLWIVQLSCSVEGSWNETRGAVREIPRVLGKGVHDLGDVRLADAVLAVRGNVRGPHGVIADVCVTPHSFSIGIDVRCGDGGAFEVWALPARRSASLQFSAPAHAARGVTTPLPGADLDIVLAPDGECVVEVAVDPEVVAHRKSIYAELIDAAGSRWRDDGWSREDILRYSFRVLPGTYRCEVRSPQQPTPLATVDGIVVAASLDPARPVNVDLRGRLRAGRCTWVDDAGQPVRLSFPQAFAPATRRNVGDRAEVEAITVDGDGMAAVATESLAFVIESEDLVGSYEGPAADAQVRLRPWPHVTLHVPGLPQPPARSRWQLQATAESGDATLRLRGPNWSGPRRTAHSCPVLGADGNARMRLLGGSRYRIQLDLVSDPDSGTEIETTIASVRLDVPSPLPALVTMPFDAERLRAAVR